MAETERDQTMSRIGDERHAGVADESDFCALFERNKEFGRTRHFVVFVVADEGLANFVVVEEFLRVARVFAGNLIDFFEDAEGAEGDVFEIADGRADQIQAAQCSFCVDDCGSAHGKSLARAAERVVLAKEKTAAPPPAA